MKHIVFAGGKDTLIINYVFICAIMCLMAFLPCDSRRPPFHGHMYLLNIAGNRPGPCRKGVCIRSWLDGKFNRHVIRRCAVARKRGRTDKIVTELPRYVKSSIGIAACCIFGNQRAKTFPSLFRSACVLHMYILLARFRQVLCAESRVNMRYIRRDVAIRLSTAF